MPNGIRSQTQGDFQVDSIIIDVLSFAVLAAGTWSSMDGGPAQALAWPMQNGLILML